MATKRGKRKASKPQDEMLFTAMTKGQSRDLWLAKGEMSARYLPRLAVTAHAQMALRAAVPSGRSVVSSNVVGVGVDEKYVSGVPTGVHVVKFLVRSKLPKSALTRAEMLPSRVGGLPTDVEEVGLIVPMAGMPNPKTKIRPAQPGCSVGYADPQNKYVMAGTFGALVKDSSGHLYVLSNNHVLANESGYDASGHKMVNLPAGTPIYEPGLLDNGSTATDKIATLTRWVDLRADKPTNKVDGAIARLTNSSITVKSILFIGPPTGAAMAQKDMIVHKFGRTTSYRAGRVSSVLFDVQLQYAVGNVTFTDQIAIRGLNNQPFSKAGDSGSAILDRATNQMVGLLFAGTTSDTMTFANHAADVFKALKVKLA